MSESEQCERCREWYGEMENHTCADIAEIQALKAEVERLEAEVQQAREAGARSMYDTVHHFWAENEHGWDALIDRDTAMNEWHKREQLQQVDARLKVRCEELKPALDYLKDK